MGPLLGLALTGCGSDGPGLPVVDLLKDVHRAERRPPAGVRVAPVPVAGVVRPALVAAVPSRVTWTLPMPDRAVLRTFVSIGAGHPGAVVRLRVGVSDERIYEGLAERVLTGPAPGWSEWTVDLSAYAGFQWSLFYRPGRTAWRLVLAADAVAGSPPDAFWGSPQILTDGRAAAEYATRRAHVR